MSHWSYRLIRFKDEGSPTGYWVALHEVYYDDEGKPVGWTKSPADFGGTDREAAVKALAMALDAIAVRPILEIVNDKLVEAE